jgi:Flp pilus assembly protein TadG
MGAPGRVLAVDSRIDRRKVGEITSMHSVKIKNTAQKNQRGQSIIELTLITPLLLAALYVPVDFGISLFVGNLTQTAVREGARIGSGLQLSGTVPTLTFGSANADIVKTEVFNRLPTYLGSKNVTVKFYGGTGCMQFIEVSAQGEYNFSLYKAMRLFGGTAPNSITISRTTQMYFKYQPYNNNDYCAVGTTYGPYSS